MRRRAFLLASVAIPWLARAARAQAVAVRQLGIIAAGSVGPDELALWPAPLLEGLRALGWHEGRNLAILRRPAQDRPARLPDLAAELVRAKVDAIVTIGTPAALAARDATTTIPIVMATIGDPVGAGLVRSLGRPGGNITGNTFIEPDLGAKRLETLKELVPGITQVGILMNPANPAMQMLRDGEARVLRHLDIEAIFVDVTAAAELEPAIRRMRARGAQALIVHSDSLFISNRAHIMRLALAHGLPTLAEGRQFVAAGALASYAPDSAVMMRNAAVFVDKIFRGARAGDLPIERPTRFELVVNDGTAAALGLTIPAALRVRVDEVLR